MIKRICIAILSLSLLATAVGCRRSPADPSDTDTSAPTQGQETEADVESESVTDSAPGTEQHTEPATEPGTEPGTESATEPSTGQGTEQSTEADSEPEIQIPEPLPPTVVASFFETATLDGTPCFSTTGNQDEHLTAAGNLISIAEETNAITFAVSGWIGFDRPIDCFGFRIDGEEPVFGNFALYTEDNVKSLGGDHALRFAIYVPLFDLNPGDHTLELLARLNDGTVVRLRHAVTLQMGGLIPDTSRPYHAALTHINSAACADCKGDSTSGIASANGAGVRVGEDGRITVSGWLATEGGVDRYAWSVDGVNWYDAETNGTTGEPDGISFSSLGYKDAAVNAQFSNLILNLSPYDDQTVDVILGAVSRNAPDNVIPFAKITALAIPDQMNDIFFSFTSDAAVNPEGTDLRASDLSDMFFINYGVGEPRSVVNYEGVPCYVLSGIHEMYTNADGRFALSSKLFHMDSTSFLFVRGYHAVISDDLIANGDPAKGQFHINNFYETDSAGAMGGAGIYAGLHEGNLTVMVKYYDPNCISRVGNHITTVACKGSTLTMTDDGNQISIFVDGKLKVTVQLKGSITYSDINNITPYGSFASSAVISVAGGKTTTIRNTLVAATCRAQCGLTIRGGTVYFADVSLLPLSESGLQP